MVFVGVITQVEPAKSGINKEGKPWMTQDFIVARDDKNKFLMNIYGQQRLESLKLQMGDKIKVELALSLNYWSKRYYNVVKTVNVEKLTQEEYEQALNEYPLHVPLYSTTLGDNSMPEGTNNQVEPQRHAVEAPVYTPQPEPQPQKFEDVSDDSLPF